MCAHTCHLGPDGLSLCHQAGVQLTFAMLTSGPGIRSGDAYKVPGVRHGRTLGPTWLQGIPFGSVCLSSQHPLGATGGWKLL